MILKSKKLVLIATLIWVGLFDIIAQERDFCTRIAGDIGGAVFNNVDWKMDVGAQLESYSSKLDYFRFQPEIKYSPFRFLNMALSYRITTNPFSKT